MWTLDLRNGGVRLDIFADDLAPEVTDAIAQAEADILSGAVVVSAIGDAAGMNARLDELFPE